MLIAMLIAMVVIGIASIYAAACLKHISEQIMTLSQQMNGPSVLHGMDKIDTNITGLRSLTARSGEKMLEELELIRKGRKRTKIEEQAPFYPD